MKYVIIDEADNLSDHCVIMLELDIEANYSPPAVKHFHRKANWRKATETQIFAYQENLRLYLKSIYVPFECLNCTHAYCKDHVQQIENYFNAIIKACVLTARKCLPFTSKKRLAGWSDCNMHNVKEESIFWYRLWVDNGRPRNGIIAEIKRKTHANYKREVKRLKSKQAELRANKLASALINKSDRNFWSEVRALNRNTTSIPNHIDQAHGDVEISNTFCEKYKTLYTSVPYDVQEMNILFKDMHDGIIHRCHNGLCESCHNVNVEDVCKSIKCIKPCKTDGVDDISSDILINACEELNIHMSLLFTMMLTHGYCPKNMLISTLIPITKDKTKSINNSDNYRAIALGSILCKVLDNVFLSKHRTTLLSHEMQFGFKSKHSTTQCSFVLQEVIDYYTDLQSPMLLLFLDASKAFDRVNYVKLFRLLLQRGLCHYVARLLAYMYTNQYLRVKWNDTVSDCFKATNGVKQGAVISPILFCIYIDELFKRLENSRCGCYIGKLYYGVIGYADDVCLLAPSRTAMLIMIQICEQYGNEYDVVFNPGKTQLILYDNNTYRNMLPLTIYGKDICIKNSVKHLGITVSTERNGVLNIQRAMMELTWRTNSLLSKFSSCNSEVKLELFRKYCTSYYGCQLWNLNSRYTQSFFVCWRNCIRKIWKISRRTHCFITNYLYDGYGIELELLCRSMNFLNSLYKSSNQHTSFCAELCKTSRTHVACNRRLIMSKLKCNVLDFSQNSVMQLKRQLKQSYVCSSGDSSIGCLARELCLTRDGIYNSILSKEDINYMLIDICEN